VWSALARVAPLVAPLVLLALAALYALGKSGLNLGVVSSADVARAVARLADDLEDDTSANDAAFSLALAASVLAAGWLVLAACCRGACEPSGAAHDVASSYVCV